MEKTIKLDLCSEKFDSLSKLNAPTKCQHEVVRKRKKKIFKCNVCGHESSKGSDLVKHTRTHTGERPFKCKMSDCGVAFKEESALNKHNKFKHSDERAFKCDFPGCRHTAKAASDLTQHRKTHSDDRPFACRHSRCNFRAKRKDHLFRHRANVHSESKTLNCCYCEYNTNMARNLTRHMSTHEDQNESVPCSITGCEYKGKNSKALKDHTRRHKSLQLCPVSRCGHYVTTKEALEDHMKLHNPSGRAFQCPLCFKYFRTLVHLQQHCFVHTNEKPFECGQCEFAAATQAHVKRHISSVHAAIEFPFIVHLLDDRECLPCKVILPSVDFGVHCKGHVEPVLMI